jgi:hypothetical protein
MRLLAVVQSYPPFLLGGSEIAAHTLFRWLVDHGHEVRVHMTDRPMEAHANDGVEVIPAVNLNDARRADVVYTHLYPGIQATAELARHADRPLVYWAHAVPSINLSYPPALLMANSEYLASVHGPRLGAPVVVIRPPVFAGEYRTDRTGATSITRIGLSEEKGGRIFWELAYRMRDHSFLGVLGGWGAQITTGPAAPPPNVEVWPTTLQICDVYAQTRVLIMPSDGHETYGRIGVEAMASGIPIIATDLPGVREAFGDAAAYVADRNDLAAWEAHVRRLDDDAAYGIASRRALARSAQLDPTGDLNLAEACLVALAERRAVPA